MNARDKLMRRLGYTIPLGIAEILVNDYAHELAEEIRDFAEQGNVRLHSTAATAYVQGVRDAADLIDPYWEGK